jgi:hypothetical protein
MQSANTRFLAQLGAQSLIRACTTHGWVVVCRTSILVYKQMYRHLIQPTDREIVCKLFNVLHEA